MIIVSTKTHIFAPKNKYIDYVDYKKFYECKK